MNVAPRLRQAMTENRGLRVFVASGYYDLATPYFATHYTVTHLRLARSLAGHLTTATYDGGHMMYTDPASRRKLKKDLAAFYQAALPREDGKK